MIQPYVAGTCFVGLQRCFWQQCRSRLLPSRSRRVVFDNNDDVDEIEINNSNYYPRNTVLSTTSQQLKHASSNKRFISSSSSSNQKYPTIHDDDNPFEILGIPKASSYEVVKRRFVELALKHHPDVAETKNDDDTDDDRDIETFIRLRQAFETIRENEDGSSRLVGDSDEDGWSDEEFYAWFYEETGHRDVMFKMDIQTRKEVIDVIKTDQSQGGLDKGGMWELARSMAQEEQYLRKSKSAKDGKPSFKGINAGQTPEPRIRRRRR